MTDRLLTLLLILASIGSGLIGGLFFIFSNTIMSAFDRLPDGGGVPAMQRINEVILNPLFFLAFFGTGVLCLALLVFYLMHLARPAAGWICVAALLYVIGSIGVTMVCNVPLNNQLATISPTDKHVTAHWQAYRGPWTRWNHVRTVACLLSAAILAFAIRY